MANSAPDRFVSRWGLILAALGMAIGTGNIWRFPRIMAANGGGSFLIPWLIFLFTWSIPLLVVEGAMGKKARRGTIGAFTFLVGSRSAWKGAFIAFVSIAIVFYYSVVMGWCIRYFSTSILGLIQGQGGQQVWDTFIGNSKQVVFFQFFGLMICAAILYRGVAAGIEKYNKILIPSLFAILIIAAIRAVTLPNASAGLDFLFTVRLADLGNYKVWLEALTQSAWSTGAGWGLMLTYAVYMKENQNIVFTSTLTGLGNNSASMLAAMALIPTVFAVLPAEEALRTVTTSGPASTGITFIYFPELLERIPGGAYIIMPLFFLGLSFAAISSMLSMLELGVRNLSDYGIKRNISLAIIIGGSFLLGLPSALSLTFFSNQDWVWGLGLMVSGFFFATAVRRIGGAEFRDSWVNTTPGWKIGKAFTWVVYWLIPIQFVAMLAWWFYQSIAILDPDQWWNPFRAFSLGTVLLQWGIVIVLFLIINPALARQKEEQP